MGLIEPVMAAFAKDIDMGRDCAGACLPTAAIQTAFDMARRPKFFRASQRFFAFLDFLSSFAVLGFSFRTPLNFFDPAV